MIHLILSVFSSEHVSFAICTSQFEDLLLKGADCTNVVRSILDVADLVIRGEEIVPRVVGIALAGAPVGVIGKTANGCFVQAKFVQFIYARQIPVAIATKYQIATQSCGYSCRCTSRHDGYGILIACTYCFTVCT